MGTIRDETMASLRDRWGQCLGLVRGGDVIRVLRRDFVVGFLVPASKVYIKDSEKLESVSSANLRIKLSDFCDQFEAEGGSDGFRVTFHRVTKVLFLSTEFAAKCGIVKEVTA